MGAILRIFAFVPERGCRLTRLHNLYAHVGHLVPGTRSYFFFFTNMYYLKAVIEVLTNIVGVNTDEYCHSREQRLALLSARQFLVCDKFINT